MEALPAKPCPPFSFYPPKKVGAWVLGFMPIIIETPEYLMDLTIGLSETDPVITLHQ